MSLKNIIIIGSSTGGPRILTEVFLNLPKLNASILVIQHMPKFINESICKRLNTLTEMNVVLAQNSQKLEEGTIYIAPSEFHLKLIDNKEISLYNGKKVNYVMPAIDISMISLKKEQNLKMVGIILTGMGKDGAAGINHIKVLDGMTIAQTPETCMIPSMPNAAIKTGDVDHILSPKDINIKLATLFRSLRK